MRELAHRFLSWFPLGVLGIAGFVAAINEPARHWMSGGLDALWIEMGWPPVTAMLTLMVFGYIGLLVRTGMPKSDKSRGYDSNLESKQIHQRKIISDGRKLIAEFNAQTRIEHLIYFLESREEWNAIRSQMSPSAVRDIEDGRMAMLSRIGMKDGKVHILREELDRLERTWNLV